jgi:hypothetical protein
VSVHGEFQRLLTDCVTFLETSSAEDSERWCQQLRDADALREDSLSLAAQAALKAVEGPDAGSPRFSGGEERRAFEELLEHFAAICRLVLGQPAKEGSKGELP